MTLALLLALAAQAHAGHARPAADPHAGHGTPAPAPAADPHAGHAMPSQTADPHAGHDMGPQDDPHAGHDMGAAAHGSGGTALPAGDAPAPAAPRADYADRVWGTAAMAPARDQLRREHGGGRFDQLMLNIAEVRLRDGRDAYAWDGEYWWGGDIDRLVVKSEGEGDFAGGGVGEAEVQLLYSRAIGPYFDVQAGVRQDLGAGARRTWASVGIEGLAPYWFDVEGTAFLSDGGELFGRVEASADQRITQRLILQPRVELELAAQDVPALGVEAGLASAEAGLRLRYEIAREFAPYVGVNWERRFGDFGEDSTSLVAGVRFWF